MGADHNPYRNGLRWVMLGLLLALYGVFGLLYWQTVQARQAAEYNRRVLDSRTAIIQRIEASQRRQAEAAAQTQRH